MFRKNKIAIFICFLFFVAYTTLALVKHYHFLSGYDLAIVDQAVWKYSQFKVPITTIHSYAFTSLLADHVEIIYILLAPFYWIYNNSVTLIVLQTLFVSFSGIPVYLLARNRKLPTVLSLALLISYLSFYGVQNAIWSDVHSLAFGAAFLPWFIYFLYKNEKWRIFASLILALISKEDIGLLTFFVGLVYFVTTGKKIALITMAVSALYVFGILYIYFPYFTQDDYRYAAEGGLFSDIKISYLYDTTDKLQVYFYSLGWFGFVPLLAPFYLLPAFADIGHYFVFGHAVVTSAQGLFMHYRISLAVLLAWPVIIVFGKILSSRYKKYFNVYVLSAYIFISAVIFQYLLHAPLSYLSKQWFWTKPQAVSNINYLIKDLPPNASVVSQNNITPHIAHRDNIFTLWPETRGFTKDSPCRKLVCRWFRWAGDPEFMIVDTSPDWDARHFLANREDFVAGIQSLEKSGIIRKYKQRGNAVIYMVLNNNIDR